jgi:hypothetical protein
MNLRIPKPQTCWQRFGSRLRLHSCVCSRRALEINPPKPSQKSKSISQANIPQGGTIMDTGLYANRLISTAGDEAAALGPGPCPCSRRGRGCSTCIPRLDRFAIRAQPALTSISHIPDLRSLNTSTNHASSLAPDSKQSLRTQLNAELPPLKTPDLK